MAIYSYAIAAGNDNAAGLVNIENITPSGDNAFYPPAGIGTYNPGDFRMRGDSTLYLAGYASCEWVFRKITRAQLRYLMDTYCSSSYSGKVTITTKTDNANTYANYNAVMLLPKLVESARNFTIYSDYRVRFIKVEAL
jgi:hypothetical protein